MWSSTVVRSTFRAVKVMEGNRQSRFRFKLGTILVVVAFFALLSLVVIQQLQMGRMRQTIDAHAKQTDQLTTIIRELRDRLER
jgi:NADH:ubiquinone oxidoreductase subunit 6 (subunit J)